LGHQSAPDMFIPRTKRSYLARSTMLPYTSRLLNTKLSKEFTERIIIWGSSGWQKPSCEQFRLIHLAPVRHSQQTDKRWGKRLGNAGKLDGKAIQDLISLILDRTDQLTRVTSFSKSGTEHCYIPFDGHERPYPSVIPSSYLNPPEE
jgi:hypothetical protein